MLLENFESLWAKEIRPLPCQELDIRVSNIEVLVVDDVEIMVALDWVHIKATEMLLEDVTNGS